MKMSDTAEMVPPGQRNKLLSGEILKK